MFGPVGRLRAPAAGMAGPAQVAFQLMLLEAVSPWPRKIQEGWEKSLPTSELHPIHSIQSSAIPARRKARWRLWLSNASIRILFFSEICGVLGKFLMVGFVDGADIRYDCTRIRFSWIMFETHPSANGATFHIFDL